MMKNICKWGITSSEHSFWNKTQEKALEPGNVYSQNTQGIRSLYGLAVPDKEAPISCCFGEQILSFGSSYVAVTPRLITWHPVCDPKKVQTSGASHPISRRVFQAKSKWAQLLSPVVFIFFIVRTPKVVHFTCSSPRCAGRLPQLWTSSFERLREEGLAAPRPAATRHIGGAANGDEGFHLIYRDPDHITRPISHQFHLCFYYIGP